MLGLIQSRALHTMVADNDEDQETIIITVYEPDPQRWPGRLQGAEISRKCPICKHGETQAGTAMLTLTKGEMTLVVRGVPARICANCGEEYIDEQIVQELLEAADGAAESGVKVEVREYLAA